MLSHSFFPLLFFFPLFGSKSTTNIRMRRVNHSIKEDNARISELKAHNENLQREIASLKNYITTLHAQLFTLSPHMLSKVNEFLHIEDDFTAIQNNQNLICDNPNLSPANLPLFEGQNQTRINTDPNQDHLQLEQTLKPKSRKNGITLTPEQINSSLTPITSLIQQVIREQYSREQDLIDSKCEFNDFMKKTKSDFAAKHAEKVAKMQDQCLKLICRKKINHYSRK